MSADMRKPFNPILGETFQGYFKDGTRIYCEHISHHPPIASYLIEGPTEYAFRMYGSVEFKGSLKGAGNILYINFDGANYIEFPDGHKYVVHYPLTKLSGLMWGARTVNIEGISTIDDLSNGNKAIVVFDPKVPRFDSTIKPTNFEGIIYKSNGNQQKKKIESLSDISNVDEEICEVYGDTLNELIIDGETFWIMDREVPYRLYPMPDCLPSDSRYREDLLWLHYEDQKYAQEWKSRLEIQQRQDKKQRMDYEKLRSKGKKKFINID